MLRRDRGIYWPEDVGCLRCRGDVDPELPHYFVRDPNPKQGDLEAFIGLLHPACQPRYLADAEAAGIVIVVSGPEPDAEAPPSDQRPLRPPPSALRLPLDASAFTTPPPPPAPPPAAGTPGWRGMVAKVTGGRVAPAPKMRDIERSAHTTLARTPIAGSRRVAVVSRKGGVGKTTTTLMLGHTFASLRNDRVVALDANPDAGSLGYRVRRSSRATLTTMLTELPDAARYADVRAHTQQTPTMLEVVASDDNARITSTLGEHEMVRAIRLLDRYYNLILVDTGTGILDTATQSLLRMTDQIVVVAVPSLDGARAASLTLDWLDRHGYAWMVRDAVAVLNRTGNDAPQDVAKVSDHFSRRCRACVLLPWDEHLHAGGISELDALARPTREAYLRLAAEVAAGFRLPVGPRPAPS